MSHEGISYPESIPVGTAVPAWAYQDVSATDFFNLTVAFGVAAEDLPDTTASVPPGSSTSVATLSGTGSVGDSSPTTHASSSSSSSTSASASPSSPPSAGGASHSIVGPVVGGVVGGVLGAVALGSLLFYFLRRRSQRSAHHPEAQTVQVPPASPGFNPTPKSGAYEPWQTASPAAPLLYNPEDPRTYPAAAAGGPQSTSTTLVQPASHANLAYHGTAEL
ncbi:hypothetical protein K466DRAFT_95298 [Polyporus arcularius HHB13444]|uniref:Uncharacterized protein n=1 Tax=Polyporus arcularius HHB13444 TaxID=1314778 RepID=A0A5C3NMK9_9APHY|nr:hypothetical protein K466DRAFT_95298 [Polyporus arcularius HHB13444]